MAPLPSFGLDGASALCASVRERGFSTFNELAACVRAIPYGRPESLESALCVVLENRGTCSSKHQLLARVAHECGHPEVALTVGIYEMSEDNTPGVGAVLRKASLSSVPEAHCYLSVEGVRFDFTGLPRGRSTPFDALVSEHLVALEEMVTIKSRLHRQALDAWAIERRIPFARVWAAREACIEALTARAIEHR